MEPPHVHVGKSGNEAKYWLNPIALANAGRFRAYELGEIERILKTHQAALLIAWEKEQQKYGHG